MKKIIIFSVLVLVSVAISQDSKPQQSPKIVRENIEWCDIWIPSAPKTDKPRVLLIGDSITRNYYDSVCRHLKDEAYCSRFTTSASVCDPAFLIQLKVMFTDYEYDVIHFNNGLHGVGYTEEEYKAGCEKALKYIREKSPSSKIVLALSTPVNPQSQVDHLNPRIVARNCIVEELAKEYHAEMNDLHSISKDHPEYYRDSHHYKPEAISLQAEQVSDTVRNLLK